MHSTSVYGLKHLVLEGGGGKALATDHCVYYYHDYNYYYHFVAILNTDLLGRRPDSVPVANA